MDEPELKEDFENYAKDFERFLSTLPVSEEYSDFLTKDSNIIFMGYGKEDLFPQVYDTCVKLNDRKLAFDPERTMPAKISHKENALLIWQLSPRTKDSDG